MEKIIPISLKLSTPNTSGSYGLNTMYKKRFHSPFIGLQISSNIAEAFPAMITCRESLIRSSQYFNTSIFALPPPKSPFSFRNHPLKFRTAAPKLTRNRKGWQSTLVSRQTANRLNVPSSGFDWVEMRIDRRTTFRNS